MNKSLCPRCGQQTTMVVVHGHYQCQLCKSVVDDCCSGLTSQKLTIAEEFKLKPIEKANYSGRKLHD